MDYGLSDILRVGITGLRLTPWYSHIFLHTTCLKICAYVPNEHPLSEQDTNKLCHTIVLGSDDGDKNNNNDKHIVLYSPLKTGHSFTHAFHRSSFA